LVTNNRTPLLLTLGCLGLIVLIGVTAAAGILVFFVTDSSGAPVVSEPAADVSQAAEDEIVHEPSLEPQAVVLNELPSLSSLYETVSPGVVNINVFLNRNGLMGGATGSGFVLDDNGYIVTNQHVVAEATSVSVVFYNGDEAQADVIGEDPDSDLAIIRVEQVPEGVHPLELGDSDQVLVGDWVVAIGNPFGNQSSMSLGIVSAVGRTIDSIEGVYGIPQAIQTDAAINPGNSGGPLLNLRGEVVGVNAQIATNGVRANAGVGFAIPVNIVSKVVPSLIDEGEYVWPYLGVVGSDVNLLLAQANQLDSQQGAYVDEIVNGGPADLAGMRGSTDTVQVDGIPVPVGGDIVLAVNGEAVNTFDDLLFQVSMSDPGQIIEVSVLRDGQMIDLSIELAPRP
jgi:2-alkenal reductase